MLMFRAPEAVPENAPRPLVFLSGSISKGLFARNWRRRIARALKAHDGALINPTRKDWTARWETSESAEPFRSQTLWELELLERADLILCYFAPKTHSSISLLEFGAFAQSGKVEVICPAAYAHSGNVRIAAERWGVPMWPDIESWIAHARAILPLTTVRT